MSDFCTSVSDMWAFIFIPLGYILDMKTSLDDAHQCVYFRRSTLGSKTGTGSDNYTMYNDIKG